MFQSMGGKFAKDEYDNNGAIVPCDISWSDFLPTVFRAIEKNGEAYIMANNRHLTVADSVAQHCGFKYHNHLIWHKGNATRNRWYMKNCEFTLYYFKGRGKAINNCGSLQMVSIPNVKNAVHPTEKPVPLMQIYIKNSSQVGDVVLDPFMGSGSTGCAAMMSGREFIGIEKDKKYFDLAVERIERWAKDSEFAASRPEGLPAFSDGAAGVG